MESDQALRRVAWGFTKILRGQVMRNSMNLNLENLEARLAPALAIYGLKQAQPALPWDSSPWPASLAVIRALRN